MPNLCSCGEPFGEPGDVANYCEECFICYQCSKRYHFCIEDPPPMGMCFNCLDNENEEVLIVSDP